ncbi:armadillo-type protein [Hyaloraphidium curvatum]|nr:armadillo-type protein [Hyaloraphidium curvatum]
MARAPGDSFAQFQGPGSSYPGIGIAYNPSGMPMPYAMQPQYAAPFQGSGFGMGAPAHGRQRSDGSHHHGHKSRQASEEARFVNAEVSTFVGEIHNLCKDQFGCRFLQRKLEEGAGNDRELIFTEVYDHFNDLMTDPFGNYLCQKMIEVATDAQKSTIVDKVGPELVNISLNMHGTRAVQKLIENLTLPAHIRVAVNYMSQSVVTLIKDLNGNHVIQKCLKTLLHEDNEFIFRAVTDHCLEVACHKHGCCVLQRCLDDSSEVQKELLVREITYHALQLVKDQFGNYVVQYVLDLGDPTFVLPMLRQFVNFVPELSMQKHSSNAIEKSIKIADPEMRSTFIGELLAPERFELLVRDQYANFVIQTALEYADPFQRRKLIELITPLLQAMRSTPFGRHL